MIRQVLALRVLSHAQRPQRKNAAQPAMAPCRSREASPRSCATLVCFKTFVVALNRSDAQCLHVSLFSSLLFQFVAVGVAVGVETGFHCVDCPGSIRSARLTCRAFNRILQSQPLRSLRLCARLYIKVSASIPRMKKGGPYFLGTAF